MGAFGGESGRGSSGRGGEHTENYKKREQVHRKRR